MRGQKDRTVQAKKRAFLAAYARVGIISVAARAAKIIRTDHYDWLEKDAQYKKAFEHAHEDACERLEKEAERRAVKGVLRYKFNGKGEPMAHPKTGEPYTERMYSDTLLIFLMKAAMPDKYRERITNEHTGPGGAPLELRIAGPMGRKDWAKTMLPRMAQLAREPTNGNGMPSVDAGE